LGGSLGWIRAIARWTSPHLAFGLLCVAVIAKQYVIVGQLGRALHIGGARLVLSTLGLMLVATPFVRAREGRRQVLALFALNLALTILAYGDLLHFRAFGSLSSVSQLSSAGQLLDVRDAIFALCRPRDLLYFADLAALLAALAWPRPGSWGAVGRRARLATAIVGAIVITLVARDSPRFAVPWNGRAYIAGDVGLAGYHVWEAWDAAKRAFERAGRASPETIASASAKLREARAETASPAFGAAAGRNLIVLQVESFQGFAAGLEIGGQRVTPHFDALAEESLVFDRFFHVTAKGRTSDAQFASNCSLLPSTIVPVVFGYAGNEFRCLPTLLAEAGYVAQSFQPLNSDFWNACVIDRKMGFQRSHSAEDFVVDEKIGMGFSDRSFLRQAVSKIAALPEPFYANVLTVTSHSPFDWDQIPRELELGAAEGTKVGHFLHAIHYTDSAIGEFVGALRRSGLLDRSVLVVFGDHDAWTRNNSNLGDFLPIDPDDEGAWFEEERRVAAAIRLPGGALTGRRADVSSQLDLAPTLATLMGLSREDTWFMGRDLLARPKTEPMVTLANGSVIAGTRTLLSGQMSAERCVEGGASKPLERCADLQARGRADVDLARDILDGDLIPLLRRSILAADSDRADGP